VLEKSVRNVKNLFNTFLILFNTASILNIRFVFRFLFERLFILDFAVAVFIIKDLALFFV